MSLSRTWCSRIACCSRTSCSSLSREKIFWFLTACMIRITASGLLRVPEAADWGRAAEVA